MGTVIGNGAWWIVLALLSHFDMPLLTKAIPIPVWVLAGGCGAFVIVILQLWWNWRRAAKTSIGLNQPPGVSPQSLYSPNVPKPKLSAMEPRISYVDGRAQYALLGIRNNSTDFNGDAENVVARLRFWNVETRKSTHLNYGPWRDDARAETTIATGDTEELILALIEEDGSGVAPELTKKAVGHVVVSSEIHFAWGEWLIDVELIGTGFRKPLPKMQLFLKSGEPPSIAKFFEPLKAFGVDHPRYRYIPSWPED